VGCSVLPGLSSYAETQATDRPTAFVWQRYDFYASGYKTLPSFLTSSEE
jgi:hypothetical protein